MHKVVFTDIDGTLIDIFTREYGNTINLVRRLQEYGTSVVLCSSKTADEQVKIRKDLGIDGKEPFIIENGGAIIIPRDYFKFENLTEINKQYDHYKLKDKSNQYVVIELGQHREFVMAILNEIRKDTGIKFKGVSDMSIDELSQIVGMPYEDASRMAKREYGETIIDIDKTDIALFKEVVESRGLKIIHGGRFLDVTSGVDKGNAVEILKDMYREKFAKDDDNNGAKIIIFFGVGDSRNDIPMLTHVDLPILVQSYDGSWSSDVVAASIPNLIRVKEIGPKGWENAFKIIVTTDAL